MFEKVELHGAADLHRVQRLMEEAVEAHLQVCRGAGALRKDDRQCAAPPRPPRARGRRL